MPRSPRVESSDGLFHVLNQGNYRKSIFESEGARSAFVRTLWEAAERFSWRVHGYCLLGNHYHLCLGTPMGNLSAGMRWLQATYALRFNGFRAELGHLFQRRFKSLIVEPGTHWCDFINYIHLNPLRQVWSAVIPLELTGGRACAIFREGVPVQLASIVLRWTTSTTSRTHQEVETLQGTP